MERNSDVVKMASFAPLLEHFDMAQWSVGINPKQDIPSDFRHPNYLLLTHNRRTARSVRFQLDRRQYHGQHQLLGAVHVLRQQRNNHPARLLRQRLRPRLLGRELFWEHVLRQVGKLR
jgi:hypothetical protein